MVVDSQGICRALFGWLVCWWLDSVSVSASARTGVVIEPTEACA